MCPKLFHVTTVAHAKQILASKEPIKELYFTEDEPIYEYGGMDGDNRDCLILTKWRDLDYTESRGHHTHDEIIVRNIPPSRLRLEVDGFEDCINEED